MVAMSHLTPGIINHATNFRTGPRRLHFYDKEAGICCGRPSALSGNWNAAKIIMDHNQEAIEASGAQILVNLLSDLL